jgi:hypothetical protein
LTHRQYCCEDCMLTAEREYRKIHEPAPAL